MRKEKVCRTTAWSLYIQMDSGPAILILNKQTKTSRKKIKLIWVERS